MFFFFGLLVALGDREEAEEVWSCQVIYRADRAEPLSCSNPLKHHGGYYDGLSNYS